MGRGAGGGGLRILPHKSWNVYNFKNRERVRRDEEKHALEEKVRQEEMATQLPRSQRDRTRLGNSQGACGCKTTKIGDGFEAHCS